LKSRWLPNKMIVPHLYSLRKEKNLRICPVCGYKCHLHGKRRRSYWWRGQLKYIFVQRTHCQSKICRKVHTWLPSFLSPLKHYANREVEQLLRLWPDVQQRSEIRSLADERTQRQWLKDYPKKLYHWAAQLQAHYVATTNIVPSLTELQEGSLDYLRQVLLRLEIPFKNHTLFGLTQVLLFPHHYRPACPTVSTV
jgi:hypothetical protein